MTTTVRCLYAMMALAALGLLALGASIPAAGVQRANLAAAARLEGGAASIDGLVHDLITALAARDHGALARLRVNEREYLDLIVLGSVAEGQPPQRLPREKAEYFWNVLDGKSRYFEARLLDEFGGRSFAVTSVAFGKGQQRFAGLTAYRQLRLRLRGADGEERELQTGSVAEVNGQFKFVSFVRD